MMEFIYLVGCIVFTGIFGYWCQREIANKPLMFCVAVFGGMIIGGASLAVIEVAKNDTSTTIGFWMEYAKMQLIDAETNQRSVFDEDGN